jgi:hypothetical protein
MSNYTKDLYLRLKKVESHLNSLHGKMSPQLETELDWQRQELLRKLLAEQLWSFNKN